MSLCHLDSYEWVVCLWKSFSKMCIFSACGWWAPTNFWAFGSLESSEKSRISWGSTNFLEAWNVRAQKTFEQQFCFTWEVFCPIGSDMFCTLCDSLGRSLVFACKHFHFRFLPNIFFAAPSMPDVESPVLSKYKNLLQQLVRNLSEESVNVVAAFGRSLQKIHPMPAKILWLFVINVF